MDRIDQIGQNGPKWTEKDLIRPNRPNLTELIEVDRMDLIELK